MSYDGHWSVADKMIFVRQFFSFYFIFAIALADDNLERVGSKNRMIVSVMEDLQMKKSLECVYYVMDSSNRNFAETKLTIPFIVDLIDNDERRCLF